MSLTSGFLRDIVVIESEVKQLRDIATLDREPIISFESQEQAEGVLKWWVDVLGLGEYVIHLHLCDIADKELNPNINAEMDALNVTYGTTKDLRGLAQAEVYIANNAMPEHLYGGRPCAEETLVHELLHLLPVFWLSAPDTTPEGVFFNEMQEKGLERMAKGLIMAKYGVSLNWFYTTD